MTRRARRYEEKKLNYKKIFAVLVFFIVIIMFVVGIRKLITTGLTSTGKISTVSYFPVYSNGKWGVIDSNGKIIIEPEYNEMPVVPNGSQALFICTYDVDYGNGTYKTKVINEKNEAVITGYDNIKFIDNINEKGELVYINNILIVEKEGKFGLVDLKGKSLLDTNYDEISVLTDVDNSLLIKKEDGLGLCDYSGNIIINPEYKEIKAIGKNYKNGYITVNKNGLYGIIDFNKSVIFQNKYLDIKPIYSSNKYAVKIDEGYRVVDKSGKILANKSFQDIKDINEENIIFKENGKYGVTNINLENKVNAKYEDLVCVNSNYYIAKNNGLYGIINSNDEVQVDFKYTKIDNNTIAGIIISENSNNQYDIYDLSMNLKLAVNQIEIKDEYMRVIIGEECKYYNFKFEEKDVKTVLSNKEVFSAEKDGKYGFINSNDKVTVEYKYDEVTEFNNYGYAGIKLNGLWGAINTKGEIVIEPTYDLEKNPVIDFIGKWHKGIGADYYTDI